MPLFILFILLRGKYSGLSLDFLCVTDHEGSSSSVLQVLVLVLVCLHVFVEPAVFMHDSASVYSCSISQEPELMKWRPWMTHRQSSFLESVAMATLKTAQPLQQL